ncbi:hypothetical protein XM79_c20087 [Vibrio vulnificus]|uniref:hypothetical protein n=1 Tax=Vibrio vulnificus TaxID=672 RepID=UPI0009B6B44B|nr:hypothetical protein [Vibrio vulnificus]OQK60969.1 hypothetical protein XM78_c20087 [Vibrio vulnificus]OQK63751.1 hypothetical protein XM79_c20087 [Vibrio vulnificus]
MAYLPFYITPEELAAYQEAQEQEILTGENLTTWHKYDVEEPFRYHFKLTALPFVISPFLLTFLIHTSDTLGATIFSFILSVMASGVFYLTIGLDYRYDYIFSSKGFVMKKRRNMPKWVNTATQAIGWVGAVVCVVMVAVVGPMALVGAGALILLSFGLLKRQPDERTEVRIGEREDWLFAYYNKKRKVIAIYHKYDSSNYRDIAKTTVGRCNNRGRSLLFFKSNNDLENILEKLSKEYQLKTTELEDKKEFFNAYSPSELLSEPARSIEFPVDDTFELRAQNGPIPDWEYLYNGKWQTASEIEQLKASELEVAKE